MFKKEFQISSKHQLSGKDKDKLKQTLSEQFDKDSVNQLFTKKANVQLEKIKNLQRSFISTDDMRLFVDATNRGEFFPTIQLVQAYPDLVKYVHLNQEVEKFIFKGANLMIPGIQSIDGTFKLDDVYGIKTSAGKVIAIGAMGITKEQYEELKNQSQKQTGPACLILTHAEDKLNEEYKDKPITVIYQKSQNDPEQQKPQQEEKKSEPKVESTESEQKSEQENKEKKPEQEKQDKQDEKVNDNQNENDEDLQLGEMLLKNKSKQAPKQKVDKSKLEEETKKILEQQLLESEQSGTKQRRQQLKQSQKDDEDKDKDKDKDKKKKGGKKNQKDDDDDQDKGKKGKKGKDKDKDKDKKQGKDDEEKNEDQEKGKKKYGKKKKEEQANEGEEEVKADQKEENDSKQKQPAEKGKEDEEGEQEEKKDNEDEKKQENQIPVAIMDQYIREAFMNAIKISITDKMMPLDPSVLYNQHMLNCARENVHIDIKQSSFKKIVKFVQQMSKEKLLDFKEAKKGAAPLIMGINRTSDRYQDWEVTVQKAKQVKKEQHEEQSEEFKTKYEIQEFYKPTNIVLRIFGEQKSILEDFFTFDQIKDYVNKYISANCTQDTNKKNIYKLDDYLFALVPEEKPEKEEKPEEVNENDDDNEDEGQQQKKKEEPKQKNEPKEESEDEEDEKQDQQSKQQEEAQSEKKKEKRQNKQVQKNLMTKQQIWEIIEPHLKQGYQLVQIGKKFNSEDQKDQKSKLIIGQFPGIQLIAEKKNNKNVTRITNLDLLYDQKELDAMGNKFQVQFACGVSQQQAQGKQTGKEIIVHGNFLTELQDFFINQCKINQRFIKLQDKLSKRKKVSGYQK